MSLPGGGDAAELTVVIPTRDRREILTRTLEGLAGQTVSGFETVVVFDGEEGSEPPVALDGLRFVAQPHAGPGAARNHGVGASQRPLILFLGDDMIPAPELVERHLSRHRSEPREEVAVLGRVRWHPQVAGSPVSEWLERSGALFDYEQLDRERGEEAGFGRFYSCNVSLKRSLFERAGGFDPDFVFDYEDLDFGWRLHEQGMVLRYEAAALAWHLHRHDLASLEARYRTRAQGEWLMARKHDWFEPWFEQRLSAWSERPAISGIWPRAEQVLSGRLSSGRLSSGRLSSGRGRRVGLEPLRRRVRERADGWYQQRVAEPFMAAWEGERDLEELRAYLGDQFELDKLQRSFQLVDEEAAAVGDEAAFYRSSSLYPYDLTAFAMSGTKRPYHRVLRSLVSPPARLLDYGCGIGSDGLRLLDRGYAVEFADFDNPSTRYLRWRLERRGVDAPVHDLDGAVPGGFDLAYAFDVLEHVGDPFALLAELEHRAAIVLVNLLEPVPGDIRLHHDLPIPALLRHGERRGMLLHRRLHDRVHLIAYRGEGGPAVSRARSVLARRLGPVLGHLGAEMLDRPGGGAGGDAVRR